MLPDGFVDGFSSSKSYIKPWMVDYVFVLATPNSLPSMIDACIEAGTYGIDTETTGLDTRVFPLDGSIGVDYLSPTDGKYKTVVDVVGICLSPMGKKEGYYIPIRHAPGGVPFEGNVPYDIVEREMLRLVNSKSKAIFANAKYDQEVLQFNGGVSLGVWEDPSSWEDVQVLAALDNALRRQKGLKILSKELLNKEMITLKELFDGIDEDISFGELDPSVPGCVEYAASDAICTVELWAYFKDTALVLESKDDAGNLHSQEMINYIEKMCVPATRWMERCRIHVNLDKVRELITVGQVDLYKALNDVYEGASKVLGRDITPVFFHLLKKKLPPGGVAGLEITEECPDQLRKLIEESRDEADRYTTLYAKGDFGVRVLCQNDPELQAILNRPDPGEKDNIKLLKEYDVLSASQLGVMLHDVGAKVHMSEKGHIQTAEAVIDEILESHKNLPFLSKISKVRSNDGAVGKLSNLYRDTDRRDNTIKANFNANRVETGRFSVAEEGKKKDPKKTGITKYNIQATPSMNDKEAPPALLYSRLCFDGRPSTRDSSYDHNKAYGLNILIHEHEPVKNTRAERRRRKIVAIDFSGVELRIITNFSREPKWIDAFFRCSGCNKNFPRESVPPKYCPVCGSDRIGDVHTLTTLELFGADAPSKPNWKAMRASGKATNFAMCFGGGPRAVDRSTGVGMNESQRLVRKFRLSYKDLQKWWDNKHAFARKYKYVLTAFGRKFPLPDIMHEENFIKAQAERNALNSPVQGCEHPLSMVSIQSPIYSGCCTLQQVWDKIGPNGVFEIWTGTKWSPAHIVSSGLKRNIKTTFDNGTVTQTSPDHKFLMCFLVDGVYFSPMKIANRDEVWRAQHELKIGDPVCTDSGKSPYGLTFVKSIEDTGEEVPMFDIQVHDDEHAFVADGIIVHNSSADITKIAMGLIYRECKKRGWLNDVCMTITMHDELVFEVEDEILEEFCKVASEIMTRNKAVLSRNWPVPLTVDCEVGNDWSVPWNIIQIEESIKIRKILQNPSSTDREVRMALKRVDGFYGGKEKVKKLKSFENMIWPSELAGCFETGRYDIEHPFTEEEKQALSMAWDVYFGIRKMGAEEETTETIKEPVERPMAVSAPAPGQEQEKAQEEAVAVQEDIGPYIYTVKEMTEDEMDRIEKAIVSCPGGDPMMIFGVDGVCIADGILVDRKSISKLLG